jgi:uncharacterized protein (TIGR00730 family)
MKKNLAIFCGARFPKLPAQELQNFKNEIADFIHSLSSQYNLVYGGGQVGLMGLVADSFLEKGALVTGVIPEYLNTVEIQHLGVTETQVVDDLHQRKAVMEKLADCYLILPGGIGTLDELCEVLTLQSLNRHKKLICIYNWQNVFDPFLEFIRLGTDKGFVSGDILDQCVISKNYEALIKKLLQSGSILG